MKRYIIYIFALALFSGSLVGCSEDSLSENSVVIDSVNETTDFDLWLDENYRQPFNIRFLYRYEDIQTDMSKDLVPARELYARIIAKMVRFLWIDAYTEVAGLDFMRSYAPRMMQVIGSGGYNSNGTITIGTAEGGQKITLYVGNWLENYLTINYYNGYDETDGYGITIDDVDKLNYYYLHTIHHEFAHILNQKKDYPAEFKTISQNDYLSAWNNTSEATAAALGFVSPYAGSAPGEDFAEVFSYYITWTDTQWNSKLSQAGTDGADRITRKLEIVKNYMLDSWELDLDELKDVLSRRYAESEQLDWSNFNVSE